MTKKPRKETSAAPAASVNAPAPAGAVPAASAISAAPQASPASPADTRTQTQQQKQMQMQTPPESTAALENNRHSEPSQTPQDDLFLPDPETDERLLNGSAGPSLTYAQDVLRRFRANKGGMVALIVIAILIFFSIFGVKISGYTIAEMDFDNTNVGFFTNGHIFGTDNMGRDLFARIWFGTRISLIIAFFAILLEMIIGVIYGGIAGFFGGKVDEVMMRIVDIIISIPYLIIVILLMMVLQPGVRTIIFAYALTGWTEMARLVRGEIMKIRDTDFVTASRILGASPGHIIVHEMIPNMVSVIIVELTLSVPGVIFTEAFLSYIGIGVKIPLASLGTLAQDGINSFQLYPHLLILPAAMLCIIMFSFNTLGDALRDAMDPKMRR